MNDLTGFDHSPRTRIVFGAGAADRLGELARELALKKVLLVSDPGVAAAGHVDAARKSLDAAKVGVAVFDKVIENPTTREVDACVEAAKKAGIDGIVGLGGGSSMDTAKGCNFLLTNGGRMQDYWGIGKASKPMLPLIAVPTTAGTGSEHLVVRAPAPLLVELRELLQVRRADRVRFRRDHARHHHRHPFPLPEQGTLRGTQAAQDDGGRHGRSARAGRWGQGATPPRAPRRAPSRPPGAHPP